MCQRRGKLAGAACVELLQPLTAALWAACCVANGRREVSFTLEDTRSQGVSYVRSLPQETCLGQALPAGAKLPASHVERSDSRESKIPAHGAGGALSGLLELCSAAGKRSTRPLALRVEVLRTAAAAPHKPRQKRLRMKLLHLLNSRKVNILLEFSVQKKMSECKQAEVRRQVPSAEVWVSAD